MRYLFHYDTILNDKFLQLLDCIFDREKFIVGRKETWNDTNKIDLNLNEFKVSEV